MKHNKHIHDEDYDINIKLMVPLLSILVCTICLCATTWAWYTASVSTGVNSIVAGANVSETVSCGESCNVSKTDGVYILEPGDYILSFTEIGKAEYGYYALIDLEAYNVPSNTASILNLFVNRVYAQGNDSFQGNIYIGKEISQPISIPITVNVKKVLKIQYVWGVKDQNTNNVVLEGQYASYNNSIDVSAGICTLADEPATVTFNFINAITGEALPYSALGIETYGLSENEELPQNATIVLEADLEEYQIFAPDGYLLQKDESRGETEDQESRKYTLEPGKDAVINVSCVVRPESNPNQNTGDPQSSGEQNANEGINDSSSVNQDPISQSNNETTSDNDLNQENGVPSQGSTEGAIETDTGESSVPPADENNGENLAEDLSGSSTGNNEGSTVSEQETGTSDTVESLLVTDTTSGEETSNDTQSIDSFSFTYTSSKTETNVSE